MIGLIAPDSYIASLEGGEQTIAVANTRVQLVTADTNCVGIIVQAFTTNAANIMVGGADVDITPGTRKGIELAPGQTIVLAVRNPNMVWIDGDQASDGVNYMLLK